MSARQETAIIIGAGPAGLTAAYELLQRTNIKPIVLEATTEVGGISRTVNYKGNRIDIGGHRFFSKSDRVMEWWQSILPVQGIKTASNEIRDYPERNIKIHDLGAGPDPDKTDDVLLIRTRLIADPFSAQVF